MLFLAIILSTQFSFGRMFALAGRTFRDRTARVVGAWREWREERRREKQRREVLKKHLDKPGATETAALATAALKASRRHTPRPGTEPEEDEPQAAPAPVASGRPADPGAHHPAERADACRSRSPTPSRA